MKFSGHITTNYDVMLNVNNRLNENLLMTWPGVHMCHTSWQDGVLATNCPIQSGSNWTYNFQVKDQIGKMFQQMELVHYGSIKVPDVYILKSSPLVMINGTLRATLNGNSFINPGVPIRLADKFHVQEAYNLDFPYRPQSRSPQMHTTLLNATYKGFVEIILVNNDTTV
ncbi:hypothetical protein POM88_050200 [Heracleum sosnowskyi]|uniref:Plastocyanin-like domain-containing protein n=1 Tax=Heracleum sosnowskyi TaxID=360622 RepID=A0AAD8M249_9APIA|nr:hypothetical protein POM88_050200 [Heracleum sosnowskyi]